VKNEYQKRGREASRQRKGSKGGKKVTGDRETLDQGIKARPENSKGLIRGGKGKRTPGTGGKKKNTFKKVPTVYEKGGKRKNTKAKGWNECGKSQGRGSWGGGPRKKSIKTAQVGRSELYRSKPGEIESKQEKKEWTLSVRNETEKKRKEQQFTA